MLAFSGSEDREIWHKVAFGRKPPRKVFDSELSQNALPQKSPQKSGNRMSVKLGRFDQSRDRRKRSRSKHFSRLPTAGRLRSAWPMARRLPSIAEMRWGTPPQESLSWSTDRATTFHLLDVIVDEWDPTSVRDVLASGNRRPQKSQLTRHARRERDSASVPKSSILWFDLHPDR